MQKHVPPPATPTRPLWLIVLSAGLIVGVTMGMRQVLGLYLPPVTTDLGIGREPFSNAMGVANLVWGIGAVFAGMIADRMGAGRLPSLYREFRRFSLWGALVRRVAPSRRSRRSTAITGCGPLAE